MCVSAHNRDIMTQGDRTRACINPVEHRPAAEISQSQLPFGRLCAGRGMRPYHCHSHHGGMVPQQRKTGHITREATTKRCASLPEFEHLDGSPRGVSTGVEFVNVKAKVPVMSHSISSAIRLPQTGGERRLREARHTSTATRAVKLNLTHSIDSSYVSG